MTALPIGNEDSLQRSVNKSKISSAALPSFLHCEFGACAQNKNPKQSLLHFYWLLGLSWHHQEGSKVVGIVFPPGGYLQTRRWAQIIKQLSCVKCSVTVSDLEVKCFISYYQFHVLFFHKAYGMFFIKKNFNEWLHFSCGIHITGLSVLIKMKSTIPFFLSFAYLKEFKILL